MTYRKPPEGWHTFGTHVEYSGEIEFSLATDEDGFPLWERAVDPGLTYCRVCGHPVLMMHRRGADLCSLDCDRAVGAGKYATRQE